MMTLFSNFWVLFAELHSCTLCLWPDILGVEPLSSGFMGDRTTCYSIGLILVKKYLLQVIRNRSIQSFLGLKCTNSTHFMLYFPRPLVFKISVFNQSEVQHLKFTTFDDQQPLKSSKS